LRRWYGSDGAAPQPRRNSAWNRATRTRQTTRTRPAPPAQMPANAGRHRIGDQVLLGSAAGMAGATAPPAGTKATSGSTGFSSAGGFVSSVSKTPASGRVAASSGPSGASAVAATGSEVIGADVRVT